MCAGPRAGAVPELYRSSRGTEKRRPGVPDSELLIAIDQGIRCPDANQQQLVLDATELTTGYGIGM
jgi:hypothetical protein